MIRRIRLREHAPHDRELWKQQYYAHQKHWQRRRLLALKAIWDGLTLAEVSREQHVRLQTLSQWLNSYLHGGFEAMLSRHETPRQQRLSPQRQRIIRFILLHKQPVDYGIDSYQWTANLLKEVIYQKWEITISAARLYQLFDEWGLSFQKVHRDYGPTNARKQAEFIAELKKKTDELNAHSALIALDEFALQSVPYTHYAWAEKNTKPKIKSDEQHREKLNGFLAVDVTRGDTHVEFNKKSTTAEAVSAIVFIILIYLQKGFTHLTFLLDNARIHGTKMEANVQQLLAELTAQLTLPPITLLFWHTPSYSPKLNPAEYIIHEVRRQGLYNLPCSLTVQQKADRIKAQLARGSPLNAQQMSNLVGFILRQKIRRF
jgi:transposase